MIWFLATFGDSRKRNTICNACTSRWRGQALPSCDRLSRVYVVGLEGTAVGVRSAQASTHLRDARGHNQARLARRAWLRGLDVGLCRPITWGPHEAAAAEIEARPAKHLAFQHFEAVDMPLDRAGRPGQGHPGFDRLVVLIQPFRKALPGLQRASGRALEPGIQLGR